MLQQRNGKSDAELLLKRIQHDIQAVIPYIQEPKLLKEQVKLLYHKHCGDQALSLEEDANLEREAARQREYLEKTVDGLKRKLAKDSELHRTDNLRVMQENTALIKEINELRREIRTLKSKLSGGAPAPVSGATRQANNFSDTQALSEGLKKEMDMQRDLIARLREDGMAKEARIRQLEGMVAPRPTSRERLPPMEGFAPPPRPPSAASPMKAVEQEVS